MIHIVCRLVGFRTSIQNFHFSQPLQPVHSMAAESGPSSEQIDDSPGDCKPVCEFYLAGKCRFGDHCHNLHEGEPDPNQSGKKRSSNAGAKSKQAKARAAADKLLETETKNTKKPSMKTATDVISRILWDEELSAQHFTVGYLDRFLGIVEKSFLAFSWEDISSVDYNALAVPKHRIEYFKYKGKKVWDKNNRLDIVFGSTGTSKSKENFLTFMEKVDKELEAKRKDGGDQAEAEDSDSDEDISITVADKSNPSEEFLERERRRPTHFLAIRVNDPEIYKVVTEVCEKIRANDYRLYDSFTPVERLHVTVTMLRITSDEDMENCIRALQNLCYFVSAPPNLAVTFAGIGHFYSRVIYAKPKENPELLRFAFDIQAYLSREGVTLANDYDYNPHMTLLKLSVEKSKEFHSRFIDPSVYVEFTDTYFGTEKVSKLFLCPIGEEKAPGAFYRVLDACDIYSDV